MEYNYKIYLLFGLILLGLINQGLSKPTQNDQSEPDYPNDDEEYDDDENIPPENKATETTPSPDVVTQPPYFPKDHEKYHIKIGSNAELKCNAKQLAATNVILWSKENNTLATGTQLTNQGGHYKILNDSTLIIQNATKEDSGNYYCKVFPQNIHLHVEVQVDDENSSPEEQQQPPAEHNQASQVGQVAAPTEANKNDNNGANNGKFSQSIILTATTICLSLMIRI